jgi:hypothetical protein
MVDKVTTVSRDKLGERIGRLSDEDVVRLNRALLLFPWTRGIGHEGPRLPCSSKGREVFMGRFLLVSVVVCSLLGCITNDFEVLDALQVGMTQADAKGTMASHGFPGHTTEIRPAGGWVATKTFEDLPGRALAVERKLQTTIETGEAYPVGHGLLGAGVVYLFYGTDGRLVHFYRWQIN